MSFSNLFRRSPAIFSSSASLIPSINSLTSSAPLFSSSLFSSHHRFIGIRPERFVDLLLLRDVPRLGLKGESVSVRPGFARHSLVLNGSAVYNTRENRRRFEISSGEILPEVRSRSADSSLTQSDDSAILRRKYLENEKKRINRIVLRMDRPPSAENSNEANFPLSRVSILRLLIDRHACAGLHPDQFEMQEKYEKFGRYEILVNLDKNSPKEVAATAEGEIASDSMVARIKLIFNRGNQKIGVQRRERNKIIRRPKPTEGIKNAETEVGQQAAA